MIYVANSMIALSFGWTLGIILRVSFNIGSWVEILMTGVMLALGLIATRKSEAFYTLLFSSVNEQMSLRLSTIYNLSAAIVFFYPFMQFACLHYAFCFLGGIDTILAICRSSIGMTPKSESSEVGSSGIQSCRFFPSFSFFFAKGLV